MADATPPPSFYEKLKAGYKSFKEDVSMVTNEVEKDVTNALDQYQEHLDRTRPVEAVKFGLRRGAAGQVYEAGKGTVEGVTALGEAVWNGSEWIYNNPGEAARTARDMIWTAASIMSDPMKQAMLARQGVVWTAGQLKQIGASQWAELNEDLKGAKTPSDVSEIIGKWAAKVGLTVAAVRGGIRLLKSICKGKVRPRNTKKTGGSDPPPPKGDPASKTPDVEPGPPQSGSGPGPSTVPEKAHNTLKHIEQTGNPPHGYKGGRRFDNDGRDGGQRLPDTAADGQPVEYKEWDVNPKQKGVNRGEERLVTGSDGSAYYTSDHYRKFEKMK